MTIPLVPPTAAAGCLEGVFCSARVCMFFASVIAVDLLCLYVGGGNISFAYCVLSATTSPSGGKTNMFSFFLSFSL